MGNKANLAWYSTMGWNLRSDIIHPFDFEKIIVDVSVGYEKERQIIFDYIDAGTGILVVSSPPGYGKTHLLAWLEKNIINNKKMFPIIYYTPPETVAEFVKGFSTRLYIGGLLEVPFFQRIANLFGSADRYLSQITKADLPKLVSNQDKTVVILCDEAQNADPRILSEFKVLKDHPESGDKVRIIIAGYKTEKVDLFKKLEATIQDRVAPSNRLYLNGINEKEADDLVRGRLGLVGKKDDSFFASYLGRMFKFSGGRPRELLKICKELVDYCAMNNITKLSGDVVSVVLNKFVEQQGQLQVPESQKQADFSVLSDNMMSIVRCLADNPGSTKEEISKRTDLSPLTVNTLIWRMTKDKDYLEKFAKSGLPIPLITIETMKTKSKGRNPSIYSLSPQAKVFFAEK